MQLTEQMTPGPPAIFDLLSARNIAWFAIVALVSVGAACSRGLSTPPRQDAASLGLEVSPDVAVGMSLDGEVDFGHDGAIEVSFDGGIEPSSADAAAEFPSADDTGEFPSVDGATESPSVDSGTELIPDGGDAQTASSDGGAPVTGTVLAASEGYAFPGRKVVIGSQSSVTDSVGRFSFEQVTGTYDVMVVEPGGWRVSVYYGLTKRDPILSHGGSGSSSLDPLMQSASITGTLTANFPFPVDIGHLVTVYYLADHGHGVVQVGTGLLGGGPDYGPLWVGWNGGPSVSGRLVAIGQYGVDGTPWAKGYLASKQLSLANGDAPAVDLDLSEVSIGKIDGTIQIYSGNLVKGVAFTYRLPGMMGGVGLGQCSTTGKYSCGIPDVSTLGGEYCVSIVDVLGYARAQRCGGTIGMSDFSIQVQAPPQFQKPTHGSPITKDSKLSWTGISNGVYMLDLNPDNPSAISPRIQVYTSATQLRWPDLGAIGVAFPVGATYSCQVSGLSPYASLDDLASSRGLFNEQMDRQWLDSTTIELSLVQ
jgi:hypothetical protein